MLASDHDRIQLHHNFMLIDIHKLSSWALSGDLHMWEGNQHDTQTALNNKDRTVNFGTVSPHLTPEPQNLKGVFCFSCIYMTTQVLL